MAAEKAVAEAAAAVAAEEAAKGPAVVGGDASDEAAGVAGAVAGGGGGASTPQEAGLPQEDAYGKKRAAEFDNVTSGVGDEDEEDIELDESMASSMASIDALSTGLVA